MPQTTPPTVRNVNNELDDLEDEGFTNEFRVKPGAVVVCGACGHEAKAEDLEIVDMRRVEGQSDPADMAAVVGIVCRRCWHSGTLVLTYGPSASSEDADVLAALDDEAWPSRPTP